MSREFHPHISSEEYIELIEDSPENPNKPDRLAIQAFGEYPNGEPCLEIWTIRGRRQGRTSLSLEDVSVLRDWLTAFIERNQQPNKEHIPINPVPTPLDIIRDAYRRAGIYFIERKIGKGIFLRRSSEKDANNPDSITDYEMKYGEFIEFDEDGSIGSY